MNLRQKKIFGFSKHKKIQVENYNPNKEYDLIVLSQKADLSYFCKKILITLKLYLILLMPIFMKKLLLKQFLGVVKYITGQNKYLNFNYRKLIKIFAEKLITLFVLPKPKKKKN